MAGSQQPGPSAPGQRDRRILQDLSRVRLLTGRQLERLHFTDLATSNARGSARRRTMGRLVSAGWVTTLPRRVGGERAGSAGLIYTLDAQAHRHRWAWNDHSPADPQRRTRRPWAIGWMFVSHTLDVAELYVQLCEAERRRELRLLTFDAEPAAWFDTGRPTPLKPDAHLVIEVADWERHWWVEVDRATESLPTIERKLGRYVDLLQHGHSGPRGVLPRVLVTVPDERRASQIRAIVDRLLTDQSASGFITLTPFDQALGVLPGEQARPPP